MAERHSEPRDVTTLGDFIERAEHAAGGAAALGRRLGMTTANIDTMRVSRTPMLGGDAEALMRAFGLRAPQDQT